MEPLNPKDVTVLWHGWLKKLGGFSKRWKRRYFVFLSTSGGLKELRHYDAQKDVTLLLSSTPKGVIAMTDATGICCFLPPSPSAVATAMKKHTVFNLMDSHDSSASDIHDQKFVILTPLHVHMLAFQSGREWANASESQQGLSLLATLSAFYPNVEVLHTGAMSKKRERTGHSAAKHSIISYWKRHFFVFLSSGDLLYFKDETLAEFQGRVDVRHAPTVRVTGERMQEEKKKEISAMLLKLAKLPGAGTNDRENCLVWIATPPSKMFVLKLQEDHEGVPTDGKRQELTPSAKKWLSLLLQGHAEAKYTQLEQCVTMEKFEATPEVISAIRAGIPDELRGAMWKGFSGASDMQRRAELKRTIVKVTKTFSIRSLSTSRDESATNATSRSFFDEMSGPLDPNRLDEPESRMIFSRLCAIATYEMKLGVSARTSTSRGHRRTVSDDPNDSERSRALLPDTSMTLEEVEGGLSDSEISSPVAEDHTSTNPTRNKGDQNVFPSEVPGSPWEVSARRRLLVATSRFNPFSHPCPWKASCLLLAYLDEDSAFWVINSIQDVYLPGYYHGYRPALQVDIAAFMSMLQDRAPALVAHLNALSFPIDRTAEQWFLSLFTSTYLPLPTVLRVWDAFFAQGVRILFGVGLAIFSRAEDKLFRATTASDAREILITTERFSVDADALFSHALKDDLKISGIAEERFDKIRARCRLQLVDQVATELNLFKDKLSILSQLQDQLTRVLSCVKRLLSSAQHGRGHGGAKSTPLSPFRGHDRWESVLTDEWEDEDSMLPMRASLVSLQACAKSAEEAILNIASDLNSRQARWLALSSQLVGCPSVRGAVRMSSDLQSWLLQVKEGKVSGAGLDALPNRSVKLASRIEEQHGLFFEMEDCKEFSCLFSHRNDFQSDGGFTADDFLQAMVSTIKAICAVRLECIGSMNRADWHGGRWIQSDISLPVDTHDSMSGRARSSSRSLRRSVSSASKPMMHSSSGISRRNPRSLANDKEQASTRSSLDDSVLRRGYGDEAMLRQSIPNHAMMPVFENAPHSATTSRDTIMGGSALYMDYESTYYAAMPTSLNSPSVSPDSIATLNPFASWHNLFDDFGAPVDDDRIHKQLSAQYRQSEQTLHSAEDSMMSCFSRFIRVDSRHLTKLTTELRDRALLMEDDLVQELKDVEAIVLSTKELY